MISLLKKGKFNDPGKRFYGSKLCQFSVATSIENLCIIERKENVQYVQFTESDHECVEYTLFLAKMREIKQFNRGYRNSQGIKPFGCIHKQR